MSSYCMRSGHVEVLNCARAPHNEAAIRRQYEGVMPPAS